MSENKDIYVSEESVPIKSSIIDISLWFLLKERMSNKKIQKLCYYAQALSLALYDRPIANDATFQAWVHGPVSPVLWERYRNFGWKELNLSPLGINRANKQSKCFDSEQLEVLETTWATYGKFSADELERLTHSEKPWLEQREGLGQFESSRNVISEKTMKIFYRKLINDAQGI